MRQGGIISPILFTIYIDELLKRLELVATLIISVVLVVCNALMFLRPSSSVFANSLNLTFGSTHFTFLMNNLIFSIQCCTLVEFSPTRCMMMKTSRGLLLICVVRLIITSGKNFIKITSVGMGAAKSNETR